MTKYMIAVCLLSLAACGPFGPDGSPQITDSSNSSMGVSNPYSTQALDVLNRNCTACHGDSSGSGNVYGLQDVNHMISAGLIIPGSPSQSLLYNEISTGSMPPSGALASSDQNIIKQWILSANASSNSGSTTTPTPTPSPSPSPSPSPTPTPTPAASFTYIEKTILGPKCTACHSGSGGSAGYRFDTYTGTMKAVNTKTPTSSKLYTITHSGQMPPSSSQRLNSEQENLILQWIQEGAKNN